MKKARVVLAAIAVLVVAGASFAFKAKTSCSQITLWTTTESDGALNPLPQASITDTDAGGAQLLFYTTTSDGHALNEAFITTDID